MAANEEQAPVDPAPQAAEGPQSGGEPTAEQAAADRVFQVADEGELDQLRADLEEMKDRALRSQAELDNYRKRVARQMDEERRYAELPLVHDLLPVVDNIQRAIEAAEKAGEAPALLQGFQMVARQLQDVLGKHHCKRIEALHKTFDPHLHAAIAQQPSAEHEPMTVVLVAQEGYMLHDRVVRPSQVIVAAPPAESPEAGSRDDSAT